MAMGAVAEIRQILVRTSLCYACLDGTEVATRCISTEARGFYWPTHQIALRHSHILVGKLHTSRFRDNATRRWWSWDHIFNATPYLSDLEMSWRPDGERR